MRASRQHRNDGFGKLEDTDGGQFEGIALGRGICGDTEDVANDHPVARGDAACGSRHGDDVTLLDMTLHCHSAFEDWMRTTTMRAVVPVFWRLRSPSTAAVSVSLA